MKTLTQNNEKTDAPNIYAYLDYREYLRVLIQHLKATKSQFSDRYFARLAGVGSSSYLRMVINGERNLMLKTATKFARGLKLSAKEVRYFENMVAYAQTNVEADRERFMAEMTALRPKPRAQSLARDQIEYVANSLYVILREMTVLPNFCEDPKWIAANLMRHVTPLQVKQGLELLERLKLIKRNAEGKITHTLQAFASPAISDAVEYLHYHRQVLGDSRDAIVASPFDEWDAHSKTIAIAKETLPKVMTLLREFQDDLEAILQKGSKKYHEIFQINMQLFPVTKTQKRAQIRKG